MDIKKLILDVFAGLETNKFSVLGKEEPMWQAPIVGVAAGDDAYFTFLKDHIGKFYWLPKEAFVLKYREAADNVGAGDLRVVSVVFPQATATIRQQKLAKVFPCDNWVVSRGEWEALMRKFCGKVAERLKQEGIRCAAIDLQPEFCRMTSEKQGIASVWSHRHTAFAAGLGTFGLSDGLITEKGKAVRLTSFIVEAPLAVTPRPYAGHHDWCLFYQNGSCGACIRRCPVHAISENGHNKNTCSSYEDAAVAQYWPSHIERGNYIFGCGLCQAAVPCESRRPGVKTPDL